LIWIIYIM